MTQIIRRALLAFALIAGLGPVFAQAPGPVPALPDTERRTAYTISSSTCACAVNFALYGDSTDYQNWVEVWINNVRVNYNDPTYGWTITSPTGPLASIPRPVTDAVLTFNSAQTGTVQIVGARRPRRISQFPENRGVAARDLNQALTDVIAQNRETWDKTNDVTGRAVLGLPGETVGPLPPAATRAGQFFTFDGSGNPAITSPTPGLGNVIGTGPTVVGHLAVWGNTSGTAIADGGAINPTYATRLAAAAANIPSGIATLAVQGYLSAGDGGAGTYIKLGATPSPVKAWHFQSADGAWWQLATNPVLPKQLNAKLDGSTDDSTAMQAWLDYGAAFGVTSYGQPGVAIIPTAALNLSSNSTVDLGGVLTIRRTTNIVGSLLDCNAQSNIIVRNGTFDTTAGFSSTSSNTIGTGSQTYTVPAGLVGVAAGVNVQITANTSASAHVNYMIGTITSYVGTTLTVNIAGATNGSGTFANWLIDVYPVNGNIAPSNIAVRFTTCNRVLVENNNVTNRWYNAYDSRNGSDVIFTHNLASGYVNRGIHSAAYNAGASALNNQVTFNHLNGAQFSQYGINTSATDGAVAASILIEGNRVENTTFQGIIIGGGVTFSKITNNTTQLSFSSNGAGILLEGVTGTSGLQVPQHITVTGNSNTGGLNGYFGFSGFYWTFSGNTTAGNGGAGYLFSGATGNPTQFVTLNGNVAQGSSGGAGIALTSGASGLLSGFSIIGNIAVGNAGFGISSDANTSSSNYSGNVSISNTAGAYSIGGTGNVTAGGNL